MSSHCDSSKSILSLKFFLNFHIVHCGYVIYINKSLVDPLKLNDYCETAQDYNFSSVINISTGCTGIDFLKVNDYS